MNSPTRRCFPAASGASPAEVDWADKNYLVVDDFVGIRQLLRESLRSLGAKNIDQASSGGEAMGLLSRIRYDVVCATTTSARARTASRCWKRRACATWSIRARCG
jgi:PleD family two-component response regulator